MSAVPTCMRFERQDRRIFSFPRAHLRWLTLVDGERIEVGFSSKLVVLKGGGLERLFEELVLKPKCVVREEAKRHSNSECWVAEIIVTPHGKPATG